MFTVSTTFVMKKDTSVEIKLDQVTKKIGRRIKARSVRRFFPVNKYSSNHLSAGRADEIEDIFTSCGDCFSEKSIVIAMESMESKMKAYRLLFYAITAQDCRGRFGGPAVLTCFICTQKSRGHIQMTGNVQDEKKADGNNFICFSINENKSLSFFSKFALNMAPNWRLDWTPFLSWTEFGLTRLSLRNMMRSIRSRNEGNSFKSKYSIR